MMAFQDCLISADVAISLCAAYESLIRGVIIISHTGHYSLASQVAVKVLDLYLMHAQATDPAKAHQPTFLRIGIKFLLLDHHDVLLIVSSPPVLSL